MAATEIILLERIENLGDMGDQVSVKPGYARNYLLPQNKALRATKTNIAYFEARKKHLEAENKKEREEAEKAAKKLKSFTAVLIRQASESGQLYGSVTSRDIAEVLAEQSKEKIDRAMINLNQNFKTIGLFPVEIQLHPEVKVDVTVNIARSPEEADIQAETGKALIADENAEQPLEEIVAEAAEEADLEEVLEESAFEAEQEKRAEEKAEAEAEAEAESEAEKAEQEEQPAEPKNESADEKETEEKNS